MAFLPYVLLFIYASIVAIFFGYNEILYYGVLLTFPLLLPGDKMVNGRYNNLKWADQRNIFNPLYMGGHFIKNTEKFPWISRLKLSFYNQIGIYLFWVIAIFYKMLGILQTGSFFERYTSSLIDKCWAAGIIALNIWGYGAILYYKCLYINAFRYTESKEGIWEPFSNIMQTSKFFDKESFGCEFYIAYKEIKQIIKNSCCSTGYIWVQTYSLSLLEECVIYHKCENAKLKIFCLIHIEKYSEEKMQELNTIFSKYWKQYIQNEKPKKASIIFLLCVDQYNTAIRRRLLDVSSLDQKKGRNRLPAILVFSEHSKLTIPPNRGIIHGKKEYKEMRKEILDILGISEEYNYSYYGDEVKYEEEKINGMLNEKY